MASQATLAVPATATAGDTFVASGVHPDCLATAGWSAALVLIGAARTASITGVPVGDGFTFTASAAATAAWVAGPYTAAFTWTNGSNRVSQQGSPVTVKPDPASAGTVASSYLSGWKKIAADLDAAYQAHITQGKALITEYSIGSRTFKFQGAADLLKQLHNARMMAGREVAAEDAGNGMPPRGRFVRGM